MSKLSELKKQINLFDTAYEEGNPMISDTEYEKLYAELKDLEERSDHKTDLLTENIPYIKIENLDTVKHSKPILSLDKVKSSQGIEKWYLDNKSGTVLVQPKLDGLTVVLKYQKGMLVDAITRGNGQEGDRILHTVQTITNLPKRINYLKELEIRGEIYIPFAEFDRINNGTYANPRSMVAGNVRLLDSKEAAKRKMEIKIFDLISSTEKFETDYEQLIFLFNLGFPIVESIVLEDVEKVTEYCSYYEKEIRKNLPYPIDGLVIKINNLGNREELGVSSKAPRWAVAYKFASLEEFTTLRDVNWQIGKTGQITPVAIFDPVEIDGVSITRATLHNHQFILDQGIGIGSRIVVARANDVIPKIIKAIDKGLAPIAIPTQCPECGSLVKYTTGGVNIYCPNTECPAQVIEKIVHFCSRDALDIEGMGESNVKTFVEKGFITSPVDLYTLHEKAEHIKLLEGYGEKSVQKLLIAIEKSKKVSFERVLFALSIPLVGLNNARILAEEFKNIDTIMFLKESQLMSTKGVGPIMAENIVTFFKDEKNIQMVTELRKHGLNFEVKETKTNIKTTLLGLTFAITGTLKEKRSYYENLITSNSGQIKGSVTKKTDYLILGPDKIGSSKHRKAIELGIPIINEKEFFNLLNTRELN